jgi:hypothetical protein
MNEFVVVANQRTVLTPSEELIDAAAILPRPAWGISR